jgi:peptidyl-prolyl cis-trans isomerase A (cyclophilin A)
MRKLSPLLLLLCSAAIGCKSNDSSTSAPSTTNTTSAPAATPTKPGLPPPSRATDSAPNVFHAKFSTTKGEFVVEVHRDWAPQGADRFFNLVKMGYFSDIAFFRVVKGFMVQFGIHGDPAVNAVWRDAKIPDDPSGGQSNARGMLTFATSGRDSRTVQLFINYANNANLDAMGFTPIGKVVSGMDVVDAIEGEYGEGAPAGRGPSQGRIQSEGNPYLKSQFPKLDYITSATVLP